MIDVNNRSNSKLAEWAKGAGSSLGLSTLALGAIGGPMYCGFIKPIREDWDQFLSIAKSARPLGDDAYLVSYDVDKFHKWKKYKPGEQGDARFPQGIQVAFEYEHPSLEVIAIFDEYSSLSRSNRFHDLDTQVKQLKGNQFILVVSQRDRLEDNN